MEASSFGKKLKEILTGISFIVTIVGIILLLEIVVLMIIFGFYLLITYLIH